MAQLDNAKTEQQPVGSTEAAPGRWRWLCVNYFAECADFKRLDDRTRRVRRSILEATFDEPIRPGSSKFFRDFPLTKMDVDAIEVLRDRKTSSVRRTRGRTTRVEHEKESEFCRSG